VLRGYRPSQHGTGLETGQGGRLDGIAGSEALGDEYPGIAKNGFDADHQVSQVDRRWIDRTREDDVDDLGEIHAYHFPRQELDIGWIDGCGQGVLDQQGLSGWYG